MPIHLRYKIKHKRTGVIHASFTYWNDAKEFMNLTSPGWSAYYIYDVVTKKVFVDGISVSRRGLIERLPRG